MCTRGTGGKFVVAEEKIASRRKHIVFAFKNKAESEQEAVLSDEFLLSIQTIYNSEPIIFRVHHGLAVLS